MSQPRYLSAASGKEKRMPLRGLRVVDLTQVVSGAVTTMLMADFGADVVKVEPLTGEPYRNTGYEISTELGQTNLNILRFTRGKRSVAVDLKTPDGRDILRRLLETADILVENFRPDVLTRLGFDRDTLAQIKPDLIYTTVSGFGHDDLFPNPDGDRPAYALIAEAVAGLTHLAGDRSGFPVWLGFPMADIFAGTLAFAGTLLSLMDETKRDRRVDVAMVDASLLMNELAIAAYSILGETLGPGQYVLQSPWGAFATRDGYVAIAVLMPHQWRALCDVIGRPDLADHPDLQTGVGRSRNHDNLVAAPIAEWCRGRAKGQCTETLIAAGVPAASVSTPAEAMTSPQTEARNMLVEVDSRATPPVKLVGNPIKLDAVREATPHHVPLLGEHTAEVLTGDLHFSKDYVLELAQRGVIRTAEPDGSIQEAQVSEVKPNVALVDQSRARAVATARSEPKG